MYSFHSFINSGLFSHESDHAEAVVDLACDILIALDQLLKEEYADHPHFANVSVRIGINTGPVVAGVIGLDRFLYGMCYIPPPVPFHHRSYIIFRCLGRRCKHGLTAGSYRITGAYTHIGSHNEQHTQ